MVERRSQVDARSDAGWDTLTRAVRDSTLSIGLLQLPTRRFLAMSGPAASLLGLQDVDLSEVDVASLSKEPDATRRALDLVAEGVLDGYQTRRKLQARDQSTVDSYISVRVIARNDEREHGLVFVDDQDRESASRSEAEATEAGSRYGRETVLMVGIVDSSQRIENVSSEVHPVTGWRMADVNLHPLLDLVHPADVAKVLTAFEAASVEGAQPAVIIRARDGGGGWQPMRLVVARFGDGTGRFGFALGPIEERAPAITSLDRVAELEQRLQRIAREVEAAGIIDGFSSLPDPESIPGLRDLTSRQWEILTRLLRGERVPTIARHMYLSQSTVRNHLATIFRKVGVHSQPELLERLRTSGNG